MAYIYVIKNDINDKVYIGKTGDTIENRWKGHLKDYKQRRNEKRPLYNAMKKYGLEHFWIEEVEKCSREVLSEREVYWIDYYDGYTKGYNGTKGGDGRFYLDHNKILELYDTTRLTSGDIAKECNCEKTQVYNIVVAERGIEAKEDFKERFKEKTYKKVYCQELDKTFESIKSAGRYLHEIGKAKTSKAGAVGVGKACRKKIKTSYGMHFNFI